MDKEIMSNRQAICMIALFTIGSTLVMGTGKSLNQDVWIAILTGFALSIPMMLIYSKLLLSFPGKSLYDIMINVFGNIFGKLFVLLYTWYFLHLGALVIRNFTEFVNVASLPETPQRFIAIFLAVLCIWVVRSGIEVLGRWSNFVFPLVAFIFIGIYILSTTQIKLINIKPVLYNGIKPLIPTAVAYFSFPFAESVIFTAVLHTLRQKNKTFKVLFTGIAIGCAFILTSAVRNILVLGVKNSSSLYFPSYTAVRTINIGEALQRIEILVATSFVLSGFAKISVCLYAASSGAAKLFNIQSYSQITAPIGFLMMALSILLYRNTMEMFEWAANIYVYYAVLFQIIFPIILFIAAKIKCGKNK
jgi:spore germination protein (amino acid permease)